jgi:hypothetical protein
MCTICPLAKYVLEDDIPKISVEDEETKALAGHNKSEDILLVKPITALNQPGVSFVRSSVIIVEIVDLNSAFIKRFRLSGLSTSTTSFKLEDTRL